MGIFTKKPTVPGINSPVKPIVQPKVAPKPAPEAQLTEVGEEVEEYQEEQAPTEAIEEEKEEAMDETMADNGQFEEEPQPAVNVDGALAPVSVGRDELIAFAQEMDARIQKIESFIFRRL